MDFATTDCWDCPATFFQSFGILFAGVAALAAGIALRSSRAVIARAFGTVVTIGSTLFLLMSAAGSWHSGVRWDVSTLRPDVVPTLIFMIAPIVFIAAVAVAWHRRRHVA